MDMNHTLKNVLHTSLPVAKFERPEKIGSIQYNLSITMIEEEINKSEEAIFAHVTEWYPRQPFVF